MKSTNRKVPIILGIRLMQEVYSPLLKFYREMIKNKCDSYVSLCKDFILGSLISCDNCNIFFFTDYNKTITLNKICCSIVKLHDKYYKDVGKSYFVSLRKLFECVLEDVNK